MSRSAPAMDQRMPLCSILSLTRLLQVPSISLLYQGIPTEETYGLVVQPERNWKQNIIACDGDIDKVGHLVMGARRSGSIACAKIFSSPC
jgi:hypothetical protein